MDSFIVSFMYVVRIGRFWRFQRESMRQLSRNSYNIKIQPVSRLKTELRYEARWYGRNGPDTAIANSRAKTETLKNKIWKSDVSLSATIFLPLLKNIKIILITKMMKNQKKLTNLNCAQYHCHYCCIGLDPWSISWKVEAK